MKRIMARRLDLAGVVRLEYHDDLPAYDQVRANGLHVLNLHMRGDLTTLSATSALAAHHEAPPAAGPWWTPICFIQLATADITRLLEAPERERSAR